MKKIILVFVAILGAYLYSCSSSQPKDQVLVATPAPTYTQEQIIFSLNLISNINEGRFGTTDSLQVQAVRGINAVLTNDTVIQAIGTWKPVWGPVTFTADTSNPDTCVSDNTMVLFQGQDSANPSQPLYVLAIAGTIGMSYYDWADEDFVLNTMASWPAITSGQSNVGAFGKPNTSSNATTTNGAAYISLGMNTGLNVLFNEMQDGSKGTIMQYLHDSVGTQTGAIQLAVAGHSLGGGLSPCVALSLKDNQAYWNSAQNFNITCYATAGPSPGNAKFATYFQQQIGAGFQGIYNANDVVPHAYQSNMMAQILTMYSSMSPYLNDPCAINGLITCVNGQISAFNYTSLYAPNDTFNGTINYTADTIALIYQAGLKSYQSLPSKQQFEYGYALTQLGCSAYDSLSDSYAEAACFGTVLLQEHFNAYITQFSIGTVNTIYQRQLFTVQESSSDEATLLSNIINLPLIHVCVDPPLTTSRKK